MSVDWKSLEASSQVATGRVEDADASAPTICGKKSVGKSQQQDRDKRQTTLVPVLVELDHNGQRINPSGRSESPPVLLQSQPDSVVNHIHNDPNNDANSDDNATTATNDKYDLEEAGEYWLKWRPRNNSILDETQATAHEGPNAARPGFQVLPFQVLLDDDKYFETPGQAHTDCYVCLDVVQATTANNDGAPLVAIKDMRLPKKSQDYDNDDGEFDLYLARRRPTSTVVANSDNLVPLPVAWRKDGKETNNFDKDNDGYSNKQEDYSFESYMEPLQRRHLTILSVGDRIVTYHRNKDKREYDDEDDDLQRSPNPIGLVLQFQLEERAELPPQSKTKQNAVDAAVAFPAKQPQQHKHDDDNDDDDDDMGPDTQAPSWDNNDDDDQDDEAEENGGKSSKTDKQLLLFLGSQDTDRDGDHHMEDTTKNDDGIDDELANVNLELTLTQPGVDDEADPSQTQPPMEILAQPSEESSSSCGKSNPVTKGGDDDNGDKTKRPLPVTTKEGGNKDGNVDSDSDATEIRDNDNEDDSDNGEQQTQPKGEREEDNYLDEVAKSQTKDHVEANGTSKPEVRNMVKREEKSNESIASTTAAPKVNKSEGEAPTPTMEEANFRVLLTRARQTAVDDDDTTLGDEDMAKRDDDAVAIDEKAAAGSNVAADGTGEKETAEAAALDPIGKKREKDREENHDGHAGRTSIGSHRSDATQHALDALFNMDEIVQQSLPDDKPTEAGDNDAKNQDKEPSKIVKDESRIDEEQQNTKNADSLESKKSKSAGGKSKRSISAKDQATEVEPPPRKSRRKQGSSPDIVTTKKEAADTDDKSGKTSTTRRKNQTANGRGVKKSDENVVSETADVGAERISKRRAQATPARNGNTKTRAAKVKRGKLDVVQDHVDEADLVLNPSISSDGGSGSKARTRHSRKKGSASQTPESDPKSSAADEVVTTAAKEDDEEGSLSVPAEDAENGNPSKSKRQTRRRLSGKADRKQVNKKSADFGETEVEKGPKSPKQAAPSTPALASGHQHKANAEQDAVDSVTSRNKRDRGVPKTISINMTPEPNDNPPSTTRKRRTRPASVQRTVTKRSRTIPPGFGEDSGDEDIRIMATGVALSKAETAMISKFGATLVDDVKDASSATHVIASDKQNDVGIRRTPKLMIGLCRTSNVVDLDWVRQSAKAKRALPVKEFLVLDDKKAQETYGFSMKKSLARGDELRHKGDQLLGGWWLHVCKGVAGQTKEGKKTPPEKDMKLIAEAAGAVWLPALTPKTMKQQGFDASRLLVITSDPEVKKEISSKAVATVLEGGAKKHTIAWLFDCIMNQTFE